MSETTLAIQQEVRFAVVMYGGVSLAIYINGVTQELLGMVRATAAKPDGTAPLRADGELSGAEKVYRELGQILGNAPGATVDNVIRTQFKIDILSGTSAGGINAVYLAKALANGQDIDSLQKLRVEEGDIEKLINDGRNNTPKQQPPRSLLSSQHMYSMLLKAFDDMDEKTKSDSLSNNLDEKTEQGSVSPYVDDLDLFVTATDIRGLTIPLRLSDEVVEESRHKNVFHFKYATSNGLTVNDFLKPNNWFLAFAARCTSAFPFAFEPMKVSDVDAALAAPANKEHIAAKSTESWKKYFPAYAKRKLLDEVAFGDGGYLDNKPFGHAIDSLGLHSSRLPVERRLIYIEPEPEQFLKAAQSNSPNIIENVTAGLFLARYETIREDLQRILQRNQLIERVDRILLGVDDDIRHGKWDDENNRPLSVDDYVGGDLRDMIEREGVAYGGYHRLKVSLLTDSIAELITRHAGFNPDGDEFLAIRELVNRWRDSHYAAYRDNTKKTENELLFQYDFGYRLRRLKFVIRKIGQLYWSEGDELKKLLKGQTNLKQTEIDQAVKNRCRLQQELCVLRKKLDDILRNLQRACDSLLPRREMETVAATEGDSTTGEKALATVSPGVSQTPPADLGNDPKRADAKQPSAPNRNVDALHAAIGQVGLTSEKLHGILVKTRKSHCQTSVDELYKSMSKAFDAVAVELTRIISEPLKNASGQWQEIKHAVENGSGEFGTVAWKFAKHHYEFFDHFDVVSFPILYATDVGEENDTVEVVRISPVSATSLNNGKDERRPKLGGTALAAFGGFLDRGWRENDILWGRLDGAERIIATLLKNTEHADRDPQLISQLTRKAQTAIIAEFFEKRSKERVCTIMSRIAMMKVGDKDKEKEKDIDAALQALLAPDVGSEMSRSRYELLAAMVTPENLYRYFQESYTIDRNVNARLAVSAAARSTQVVGQMFEDIAQQARLDGKPGAAIATLGSIFWGLVEVAIPGSLPQLLFRHWLTYFYLFCAIAFVAGMLTGNGPLLDVVIKVLGVTVGAHLATLLLGGFIQQKKWPWNLAVKGIVFVAVLLLIGLVVLGGMKAIEIGRSWLSCP